MLSAALGVLLVAGDASAQTCASPFTLTCNSVSSETSGLPPLTNVDNSASERSAYPAACSGTVFSGSDTVTRFIPAVSQHVYVDLHQLFQFGGTNDLVLVVVSGAGSCAAGGTCMDA